MAGESQENRVVGEDLTKLVEQLDVHRVTRYVLDSSAEIKPTLLEPELDDVPYYGD
jgi:hypothetical protein